MEELHPLSSPCRASQRDSKRLLDLCIRPRTLWILVALFLVVSADAGPSAVRSTATDREDIKLAIYDGRALVSETRRIELPKGRSHLLFEDVPATIDPSSVQVQAMGSNAALRVLEQNYKSADITRDELVRHSIGKYVTLIEKERRTKARLLAPGIYEIDGEVLIGHQGPLQLPAVPEGLVEKPILSCVVESDRAKELTVELSYLASGISWDAFYASTLGRDEGSMSLRGVISITNTSGASYERAHVSVVAGSVRFARDEVFRPEMRALKMSGAPAPGEQIAPTSEFEYHVYPLPEPVTIELGQEKQIGFLSSDQCRVSRQHLFEWSYHSGRNEPAEDSAKVILKIENSESSGLGSPLPQGLVRVYKRLKTQLLFMGEDKIDDVPKDQKFDLYIGKAFDVVGKKNRTKFRSLGREGEEASFKVSVTNRKLEDVRVVVSERIPGDWDMLESTFDYEWVTSNRVEFKFTVAPNEEKTMEYSIRINRRY